MILRKGLPILILLAACGCRAEAPPPERPSLPEAPAIAYVKVDLQGTILLDGNPVSLDQLEQALARLKQEGGVVWYYREAPQAEAPPQAMQVIETIIAARLPVRLLEHKPE